VAGLLDFIGGGSGLFGNAFDWRTMANVPNMAPPAYAQGQAPQEQAMPQQRPEPGLGDRLGAGLHNLFNAPTLLSGLAGAGQGLMSGESQDPSSLIQRTLIARGVDPTTAQAASRNRTLLAAVAGQVFKPQQQTDDIREFEYAKSQGFTGTLEQWMARKRAGAGEYGLQGIWGTDAEGNPVIIQLGKSGEAIQSKLPAGFKPGKDAQKIDLGTHWGILDPTTRQMVTTIPKDIEGKKVAEARGEAQGTAQAALPKVIDTTNQSIKLIDEMIAHPGRETATGLSSKLDPRNYIAGTDAASFQERAKQVQGRTFLEAFQSLKGGGAITEIEGSKAETAIARLGRAQSDAEYLTALNELKDVLKIGLERAKAMAAGNFTGQQPTGAPAALAPAPPSASAPPQRRRYNPATGKLE
jgi:hypothetical protein